MEALKILVQLPDDLDFLRDELAEKYDEALQNVEAGARPEFAAGFFAATRQIIENVESRYKAKREGLREASNG